MFLLLRQGRTADAVAEGEEGLASRELGERGRDRARALVAMARVFSGDVTPALAEAQRGSRGKRGRARPGTCNEHARRGGRRRRRVPEAAELMAPSASWAEERGSRAAHDARPHMILSLALSAWTASTRPRCVQRGRRAPRHWGSSTRCRSSTTSWRFSTSGRGLGRRAGRAGDACAAGRARRRSAGVSRRTACGR